MGGMVDMVECEPRDVMCSDCNSQRDWRRDAPTNEVVCGRDAARGMVNWCNRDCWPGTVVHGSDEMRMPLRGPPLRCY